MREDELLEQELAARSGLGAAHEDDRRSSPRLSLNSPQVPKADTMASASLPSAPPQDVASAYGATSTPNIKAGAGKVRDKQEEMDVSTTFKYF